MNQYQVLSSAKMSGLRADIEIRHSLQRQIAEHSRPVLQLEFGVALNTVVAIEMALSPNTRLPASTVSQIQNRRSIWRLTTELMRDYTIQALSKKWGVHTNTVVNHTRGFRQEQHKRAAIQAKADAVYSRRIAA